MPLLKNNKTILIAPLDWGLGHATRCIPIIRELLHQGCRILIAASGKPAALLQQEFPTLPILLLPGYNIRYGKGNLLLQLFLQLPRFFKTIWQEHRWLQHAIVKHKVDGVLSDNRYGLYTTRIPCVIITHQLSVQSPYWLKWVERGTQKLIYRLIKHFDECWVPDTEILTTSLAGNLSHPMQTPDMVVRYLDWLTRFYPQPVTSVKTHQLVISLSGPEPQRTLLEKELLNQLDKVKGAVLLIRGLPDATTLPIVHLPGVKMVNHLNGFDMQQAIARSSIFLSRCGYSTLMDLMTTSCRCIFIPTPGQTEQEYLGHKLASQGSAVVMQQKNFDLLKALEQAALLPPYSNGVYKNEQLRVVIKNWLSAFSEQ